MSDLQKQKATVNRLRLSLKQFALRKSHCMLLTVETAFWNDIEQLNKRMINYESTKFL